MGNWVGAIDGRSRSHQNPFQVDLTVSPHCRCSWGSPYSMHLCGNCPQHPQFCGLWTAGPELAVCRPAGSKGHVTLDMATQPTVWPKKVPSTDTSGRTARARRQGGPCSLLSCSILITPSPGTWPWALGKEWSGKPQIEARPGLRSSPPCPGPSLPWAEPRPVQI